MINSFAFNLVAIKHDQNNKFLSTNPIAINEIKTIMKEFDSLVLKMGLKLNQSIESRISQTLSSTKHTMSMLNDLKKNKKIELFNQWKTLNMIRGIKNDQIYNSKTLFNSIHNKILK